MRDESPGDEGEADRDDKALVRVWFRASIYGGVCESAESNGSLPEVFREARRRLEAAPDDASGQLAARELLSPHLRCHYLAENSSLEAEAFLGTGGRAIDATEVTVRRVEFTGAGDEPMICARASLGFEVPSHYTTDEVAAFEARNGYLDDGVRFWWDLECTDPDWSGDFAANQGLSFEYFG